MKLFCVILIFCCLFLHIEYSNQYRIESNSSESEEEKTTKVYSSEMEVETTSNEPETKNEDKCYQCLDLHYYGHYFARQCLPKDIDNDCKPEFCPKSFDCPEHKNTEKDVCIFDKLEYPLDSAVDTGDPCQECLCKKVNNHTELVCTQPNCSDSVFEQIKPNCLRKYSHNKCCPDLICDEQELSKIKCQLDGQEYSYGEQFSPANDPCLNCACNEFWNSTQPDFDLNCSRIKCHFPFKPDCVPIYTADSCCPVDYYCAKDDKTEPEEPKCRFGENTYSIGDKVVSGSKKDADNEARCLECTCVVPPEITCTSHQC